MLTSSSQSLSIESERMKSQKHITGADDIKKDVEHYEILF